MCGGFESLFYNKKSSVDTFLFVLSTKFVNWIREITTMKMFHHPTIKTMCTDALYDMLYNTYSAEDVWRKLFSRLTLQNVI